MMMPLPLLARADLLDDIETLLQRLVLVLHVDRRDFASLVQALEPPLDHLRLANTTVLCAENLTRDTERYITFRTASPALLASPRRRPYNPDIHITT